MSYIKLTRNKLAQVDAEDIEKVACYKWFLRGPSERGYAASDRAGYMHRFLVKAFQGQYVDHINGDTLDNRKSNLRVCTNQQNSFNAQKWRRKCSSAYKGVYWRKDRNKWSAEIHKDGKKFFLGNFDTEKAAYNARVEAARRLHGDFAR